jgi:ABC-type antimicrobial peptide transport system permease subunit
MFFLGEGIQTDNNMLKNYLLIAFRNLTRKRVFSIINIAGLSLGISGALVIFLVVRFESSFDNFHEHSHQIYRVLSGSPKDPLLRDAGAPHRLDEVIEDEFPEVAETAVAYQLNPQKVQLKIGQAFNREQHVSFVTPSFFRMFDFGWIAGSPERSLAEPGQVVINEAMAEKYFQGEAMGKSIRLNNRYDLVVSGIIEKMPANTDFPIDMAVSHATFARSDAYTERYEPSRSSFYQVFVRLREGVSPEQVNARFPQIVEKYLDKETAENYLTHRLQPLSEVHFSTDIDNFAKRTVSHEAISSLALVGIFLLITACINFINLTTAQAVKRSREVGVRKVMGSRRAQLIWQFMGETALLAFISILVSYLLAANLLPFLSVAFGLPLDFSMMQDPLTLLYLLLLGVAVSVLAGFYPAVVLSAFKPVSSLKNSFTAKSTRGLLLRKGLIVFQFGLSQLLIICTIVVLSQMHYFSNTSLGFEKEAVLKVNLPDSDPQAIETIRNQLGSEPAIRDISFSLNTPAATLNKYWTFFGHHALEEEGMSEIKFIDEQFLSFYDIPLLGGRNVQQGDSAKILVNQAFLREIGISRAQEALGENVVFYGLEAEIAGVVRDFHSLSLKENIPPLILMHRPVNFQNASVRIHMAQAQQAIAAIEDQWMQHFPEYLFSYEFLDDDLAGMYEQERQMSRMLLIFSLLAIFIGCLGLYGLISFMAVQKEKEVGIRKVLGGSVGHIIYIFTGDFVFLLGTAFVLAAPIGYFMMRQWLNDFTYSISIQWWMFLLAMLTGLLIAGATVSLRSYRAATANPVKALGSE